MQHKRRHDISEASNIYTLYSKHASINCLPMSRPVGCSFSRRASGPYLLTLPDPLSADAQNASSQASTLCSSPTHHGRTLIYVLVLLTLSFRSTFPFRDARPDPVPLWRESKFPFPVFRIHSIIRVFGCVCVGALLSRFVCENRINTLRVIRIRRTYDVFLLRVCSLRNFDGRMDTIGLFEFFMCYVIRVFAVHLINLSPNL